MPPPPPRLPAAAALISCAFVAFALAVPALPHLAPVFRGALALSVLVPLLGEGALFLAFPLFSRLSRDGLLEQGTRSSITDLLRAEPGLGIREVCQRLGIGWGTAVHHLNLLERADLLESHSSGRHRRFFLKGEIAARRVALCLLASDVNRRLARHIQSNPGTTQQEACRAVGISAPLAHRYLAQLQRGNLITSARQWRRVQYFAAQPLAQALAHCPPSPQGTQRPEPPPRPL